MACSSLIKFTQNAVTGPDGEAVTGVISLAVTVDNVDNTGVASWQIDLVDVPSGSVLTLGELDSNDNDGAPTASFTPDLAGGCYRIVLKTWDAINRVGAPTDTDIRNFVVLDAAGFVSPPSQIWPRPLPPTDSGEPGNKPNELNLGGQERGWAGDGTDGLLDYRFKHPAGVRGVSAGGASVGAGTIVFSNSNNVSFGLNGSTVTATITVPAQTNQTVGLYAVGNTTQNSSTTLDARTISYDGLGAATVGFSNGSVQISVPTQTVQTQSLIAGLYDGVNSISTGTVRFTNANGVSFSIDGQTISGSVAAQTNQTIGLYALGNTTQNSSTTLDARTLSFNGLGIASVGYSNGSIQISVPSGGEVVTLSAFAVGNTTQNSSTTLDQRSISFNGLGAATMGYSNGSIQVSAPAVSSLSGVGGISISTNGSTISIRGPNVTNYEPFFFSGTTTYAPAIGSLYFQPFELPANLSGGRLNRYVSFGNFASNGGILVATNSASFVSGTTGGRSVSFTYGNSLALYSLGVGTNSTRLESLWSNTFTVGLAHSVSVSSGGATNLSVTNAATLSYIVSIDSAGAYTTTTFSSSSSRSTAASNLNTNQLTAGVSSIASILSGKWVLPVGFNTTVPPGQYWLAQVYTTASTTQGTSLQCFSFVNQLALSMASQDTAFRVWGASTGNTSSQIFPGAGVYSAQTAAIPATVAFSDIRTYGTNLSQYFNFINSTI